MSKFIDTERLDFLEAHPSKSQIRGGAVDGTDIAVWAVFSDKQTLRETLDTAISAERAKEAA